MGKTLEQQLKEIRQEGGKILGKIDERNKRESIPCQSCDEDHRIKDLTLIQTHFYVTPRGCIEGDYWREGEVQFICPKTDVVNRILLDNMDVPWEERGMYENDPEEQFKRIYKKFFKNVVDIYEDESGRKSVMVNNFYVDEHREEFGLIARRK